MAPDAGPDEVDQLFGLNPDQFVSERDRMARELKKNGRADDAARIKALRRPTVSAWALNQLARQVPDLLQDYMEAADRLRDVQLRPSVAGTTRQEFQDASARQRECLAGLLDRLPGVLAEIGQVASQDVIERVGLTLRAAVQGGEERELIVRGRLIKDLEPAGFGPFATVALATPTAPTAVAAPTPAAAAAPAAPGPRPPPPGPRDELEARRRKQKVDGLRVEVASLRERAEAATARAQEAGGVATTAEAELRAARTDAADARARADQAERRLEGAKKALAEAIAEKERAQRQATRAAELEKAAAKALDAAQGQARRVAVDADEAARALTRGEESLRAAELPS